MEASSASALAAAPPPPLPFASDATREARVVLSNFLRGIRVYELMPDAGKVRRSLHRPPWGASRSPGSAAVRRRRSS